MRTRLGFTLIEVAVAGTLIGLTVAATLAIIPAGLKAQQQARMRAVAAATVATLFYQQNHWSQSLQPATNFMNACTSGASSALVPLGTQSHTIVADASGTTPSSITSSGSLNTKYCLGASQSLSGLSGGANDLTSRLVFGFKDDSGVNKYIIVWNCSVDPRGSTPGRLFELATFNYYDPH